jgi:N-acetyl-anhydromuramyl-L-alanine amidase AmpD
MPAHPSNFRRADRDSFDLIAIHITDGHAKAAGPVADVQKPDHRTSFHFAVGESDGPPGSPVCVIQAVSLRDVAWHAHKANGRSVGIEHCARSPHELSSADPGLLVSDAIYEESARLCAGLLRLSGVPLQRAMDALATGIGGHMDIDPETTHADCPNQIWDWDRYLSLVAAAYEIVA